MRVPELSSEHVAELEQGSAIDPAVIAERGYRTLNTDQREELIRLRIPSWSRNQDRYFPGLLIPMYRATGEQISHQWKPNVPPHDPKSAKPRKYASVAGMTNRIDVHPRNTHLVADPAVPLYITEGVKKADALTSRGCCTIALSGVFNWRSRLGTLGDWEDIPLKVRTVVLCFDADALTNRNVANAMGRLGKWLKSKGAARVCYIVTPHRCGGTETKGVDDFLAAGGTIEQLHAVLTDVPPQHLTPKIEVNDTFAAADLADEVLDGRYLWSPGMGWLRWDGHRWVRTPDQDVRETARRWVLEKYRAASDEVNASVAAGDSNAVARLISVRDAWFGLMQRARLDAICSLAQGIQLVDDDAFDNHPDMLNVANGVVDLRNGVLYPPDPMLLMTKMAGAAYVPGAMHHQDWTAALDALPPDVRGWYQVRCGQGATGHMTPDDKLIFHQGSGENGKTTVTTGIRGALGDYYVNVSHRALLADPHQHSTELMAFRGARFALTEETPEERRLSVVRLKQAVGTPQMKARFMRQDEVEWEATHSLFVSSNYKLQIEETDHGVWRRLVLVRFPYTFKSADDLSGDDDRLRDPNLRERIRDGEAQHEAVLNWLVVGAMKWYAADRVMPVEPTCVVEDTREWRMESDPILRHIDDRLVFDPNRNIPTEDLRADFNAFLGRLGHHPWSEKTFAARFGSHSEIVANRVTKGRARNGPGTSCRLSSASVPERYRAWLGVRFRTSADDDEPDDDKRDPAPDQRKPVGGTGGTGVLVTLDSDSHVGVNGGPVPPVQARQRDRSLPTFGSPDPPPPPSGQPTWAPVPPPPPPPPGYPSGDAS